MGIIIRWSELNCYVNGYAKTYKRYAKIADKTRLIFHLISSSFEFVNFKKGISPEINQFICQIL